MNNTKTVVDVYPIKRENIANVPLPLGIEQVHCTIPL